MGIGLERSTRKHKGDGFNEAIETYCHSEGVICGHGYRMHTMRISANVRAHHEKSSALTHKKLNAFGHFVVRHLFNEIKRPSPKVTHITVLQFHTRFPRRFLHIAAKVNLFITKQQGL